MIELATAAAGAGSALLAVWIRERFKAKRANARAQTADWRELAEATRHHIEILETALHRREEENAHLLEERAEYARRWAECDAKHAAAEARIAGLGGRLVELEAELATLRSEIAELQRRPV